MTDFELSKEEKIALIKFNGGTKEDILNILLELQKASPKGCIDDETAKLVADFLSMPYAEVCRVVSFYDMLETKVQAKYVFKICNSTPCYFSKATDVADFFEKELGVSPGKTTDDGMFSYHYIPCVGACDIGPVVMLKDAVYGNLTGQFLQDLIKDLRTGKRTT
jgi:NADH-quinone oxidoreductase subunit E